MQHFKVASFEIRRPFKYNFLNLYAVRRRRMKTTFTTTIFKDSEVNATGIEVPAEAIAALDSGKKPKVKVTLNDYSYRSTVAVMGGAFLIPLAAEHREAAGVKAGDTLDITLELDTEPRTVDVPDDLAAALKEHDAAAAFDQLAYSKRKEFVRQVVTAKAQETRDRRIAKIVAELSSKK
jgi:hypothetical protein